ncbi:MAG: hypothetical protein GY757_58465, partial [bacterium]|nr:hypothetical protein [bacterium]
IEKYHDKGAGKRAADMCVQWQTKPPRISDDRKGKIDLKSLLPGLQQPADWKKYLKKNPFHVHPFQLGLYLEDCWLAGKGRIKQGKIAEKKQLELVGNVKIIIKAILKTYPGEKETLLQLLRGIEDEADSISYKFQEKKLRRELEGLDNRKEWQELEKRVSGVKNPSQFTELFNEDLLKWEEKAQDGLKWLESKDRFMEFAGNWGTYNHDTLLETFKTNSGDFLNMYATRHQWGNEMLSEKLAQLTRDFYLQYLKCIEEPKVIPMEAYELLKENRKKFQAVFGPPPHQWNDYFKDLEKHLGKSYSDYLKDMLEKENQFKKIYMELDTLEQKVKPLNLSSNLGEIEAVRFKIAKLEEYCDQLQQILAVKDPTDGYLNDDLFQQLLGRLEETRTDAAKWAVYRDLDRDIREGAALVEQVVAVNSGIAEIVDSLKTQSREILDNKLDIDFSGAHSLWENVRESTVKLAGENNGVPFVENLEIMEQVFGEMIFSISREIPCPQERYQNIALYILITELSSCSETFLGKLSGILEKDYSAPVDLMTDFFAAVEEQREQDFIFTRPLLKKTIKTILNIKQKIQKLIGAQLDDAKKALIPMIPLLELETLTELAKKLEKIKLEMPSNNQSFKGYHALSLRFKTAVEELMRIIRIQEKILGNHFNEAVQAVEEGKSVRRPLKKYLMACVCYYRDLDKKEWDDEAWLRFFRLHNPGDIEKENDTGGILKRYALMFNENFVAIEPRFLSKHLEIVREHLPDSHWLPYLLYLSGNLETAAFADSVCCDEALQIHFPLFLDYLQEHRMWHRFVEIYRACGDRLSDQFEYSPLKIVADEISVEYEGLRKDFIDSVTIDHERLDSLLKRIPEDEGFFKFKNKLDELVDLQVIYREIEGHLHRLTHC